MWNVSPLCYSRLLLSHHHHPLLHLLVHSSTNPSLRLWCEQQCFSMNQSLFAATVGTLLAAYIRCLVLVCEMYTRSCLVLLLVGDKGAADDGWLDAQQRSDWENRSVIETVNVKTSICAGSTVEKSLNKQNSSYAVSEQRNDHLHQNIEWISVSIFYCFYSRCFISTKAGFHFCRSLWKNGVKKINIYRSFSIFRLLFKANRKSKGPLVQMDSVDISLSRHVFSYIYIFWADKSLWKCRMLLLWALQIKMSSLVVQTNLDK